MIVNDHLYLFVTLHSLLDDYYYYVIVHMSSSIVREFTV